MTGANTDPRCQHPTACQRRGRYARTCAACYCAALPARNASAEHRAKQSAAMKAVWARRFAAVGGPDLDEYRRLYRKIKQPDARMVMAAERPEFLPAFDQAMQWKAPRHKGQLPAILRNSPQCGSLRDRRARP